MSFLCPNKHYSLRSLFGDYCSWSLNWPIFLSILLGLVEESSAYETITNKGQGMKPPSYHGIRTWAKQFILVISSFKVYRSLPACVMPYNHLKFNRSICNFEAMPKTLACQESPEITEHRF